MKSSDPNEPSPSETQERASLRLVPVGFGVLILAGAVLLSLPVSVKDGGRLGWLDALFMATSAVSVTGLSTVDVPGTFTFFGQVVLLFLIQLGGLGIVTAGTLWAVVRGPRLSLARERSIHATFGRLRRARPMDVLLYACALVVMIELVGILGLFASLNRHEPERMPMDTLWEATFHAVSAFCNAGLSIWPGGATKWRSHPDVLGWLELLVFLGGIGLLTLVNARYFAFWRRDPTRRGTLTLQTSLSLFGAVFLVLAGAAATLVLELGHSQKDAAWIERGSWSLFHSVMARTAGFNVTDPAEMHPATLLVTMVLMFIGGAPGSMAGGIKTVTFALLVLSAWAALRRREDITLLRRRIAPSLVGTAVMIALLAGAAVVTGVLLLMITEEGKPASETSLHWLALAFEAFSAFGTVGLSTGITPVLSPAGKVVVILLMFAGRVGPLLLALRLARPVSPWRVRHPEEDLALG